MMRSQKTMYTMLIAVISAALGGYFGSLFAEHRLSRVSRTIRAERFELLGKDGTVRAYWGQSAEGGLVTAFVDSKGDVRAEFGVTEDGSVQWLRMCGPDGEGRIRLGTDQFSQASLYLGDDKHESRVVLGAIPSDLPMRAASWGLLFPRKGSFDAWAAIGVREESAEGHATPFLAIRDQSGSRWIAPVGK